MSEARPVAAALADALPRLITRRKARVVVKLGGSAMEAPAALAATLCDLALLNLFGQHLVVVHGGGKPIDRAVAAAGIVPKKLQGRRVTDAATLEIVVRVLAHEINPALVAQLVKLGAPAVALLEGLHGTKLLDDAGELGFVGEVSRCDVDLIQSCWTQGSFPIIPCLARSENGGWLNVNADDAAAAVAVALQADLLVFLTDTPGLLRDVNDPASRIDRLTHGEVKRLIADGTIAGGMLPKVQGCVQAIEQGVKRVQILDGRVPHALLIDLLCDHCEGTEFVH